MQAGNVEQWFLRSHPEDTQRLNLHNNTYISLSHHNRTDRETISYDYDALQSVIICIWFLGVPLSLPGQQYGGNNNKDDNGDMFMGDTVWYG